MYIIYTTCKTIVNGGVQHRLNQPYHIDAMSLKVSSRDDGDRENNLHIETSTNLEDWLAAVDEQNIRLKELQQFTFEGRVVVFIRIIGIPVEDAEVI